MTRGQVASSYKDPSGFVFFRDGTIFRQINKIYKKNYDHLMNSGLYQKLVDSYLLIPHEEVDIKYAITDQVYKIIKPQLIPFVSYPYEWCFSQLKDAALTTLKIQKISLKHGLSLKDASAYNIQFFKGQPILIDTLSFEKYQKNKPWVAYRQFCQHFLAPLALMGYKEVRLSQLLMVYLDGVPLDLASKLLPSKSWLNFSLLSHLHLQAKSQGHLGKKENNLERYKLSFRSYLALIENLESTIKKIIWKLPKTEWAKYYSLTNYSKAAFVHKKSLVKKYLNIIKPKNVWDLGANIGVFSRIASDQGIPTISFDIDPMVVEKNYLEVVKNKEAKILPLVLDLTNPSPSLGWACGERKSLIERGPADTVLALALIHHLVISNNTPFNKVAQFFSKICRHLVIEFVPKADSQVKKMLATRKDIFSEYKKTVFEKEFRQFFRIKRQEKIKDSKRILYLMQKR